MQLLRGVRFVRVGLGADALVGEAANLGDDVVRFFTGSAAGFGRETCVVVQLLWNEK